MTIWVGMMTEDPWKDLAPSPKSDLLSARRVDASLPFGFFWAKGADNRCLLVLQHSPESSPVSKLPKLKGIDVTLTRSDSGPAVLALRLLDSQQRDLFARLCLDIVSAARGAGSESEAVQASLARTWRWHHLLRGGSDERLGIEEQKGLIGELGVLRRLLNFLPPQDAVRAWRGPLGAPKDFEVGRVAIEAKARRGAARPCVVISSEHQLDESGVDRLLLYVAELDLAPQGDFGARTLSDIVGQLQAFVAGVDPSAAAGLESLLLSGGFRPDHDYSDARWVLGRELLYGVGPGFPALTPNSFVTGVLNVRYSVSLPECEPFRLAIDDFESLVLGDVNAK